MRHWLNFFSKKEEEIPPVLDIGTSSVKGLILKRDKKGDVSVLAGSLAYYDPFSVFTGEQFEREVIKRAVSKVVSDLEKKIGQKLKGKKAIVGLPPDIFVAQIVSQTYRRKERGPINKSEAKKIIDKIKDDGKRNACQVYFKERGLLPSHLIVIGLRILRVKVDGYPVSDIVGLEGKRLEFSLLVTILPESYIEEETKGFSPLLILREMGFEILQLTHEVEGLINFLSQKPDGLFLDIGGEKTRIFLVKKGILEKMGEFKAGANSFSRLLSEDLGLLENESRDLMHRYATGQLTGQSSQRIREFFEETRRNWFFLLKEKLKKMRFGIFSSEIFIFGGGAVLPEIRRVLENGNWEGISFLGQPKVRILKPSDFLGRERVPLLLDDPQYLPGLLLAV